MAGFTYLSGTKLNLLKNNLAYNNYSYTLHCNGDYGRDLTVDSCKNPADYPCTAPFVGSNWTTAEGEVGGVPPAIGKHARRRHQPFAERAEKGLPRRAHVRRERFEEIAHASSIRSRAPNSPSEPRGGAHEITYAHAPED